MDYITFYLQPKQLNQLLTDQSVDEIGCEVLHYFIWYTSNMLTGNLIGWIIKPFKAQ